MQFLRAAVVIFSKPLPIDHSWTFKYGALDVQVLPAPRNSDLGDSDFPYLIATITLRPPGRTNIIEGVLEIDPLVRRYSEGAIEYAANSLAVSQRCARTILTPMIPMYALIPECEADRDKLAMITSAPSNWLAFPGIDSQVLAVNQCINCFADRPDAAAIVAEAFSNSSALARYGEYVRLFEHAFGVPFYSAKLETNSIFAAFLDQADLGYSSKEIDEWQQWRHAATHADGKYETKIAYERDVLPFIGRMEQAVIDISLNKLNWHSDSIDRRELWRLKTATTGRFSIRFTEGFPDKVTIVKKDCFDVWPVYEGKVLDLPDEHWWPGKGTDSLNSTEMHYETVPA